MSHRSSKGGKEGGHGMQGRDDKSVESLILPGVCSCCSGCCCDLARGQRVAAHSSGRRAAELQLGSSFSWVREAGTTAVTVVTVATVVTVHSCCGETETRQAEREQQEEKPGCAGDVWTKRLHCSLIFAGRVVRENWTSVNQRGDGFLLPQLNLT